MYMAPIPQLGSAGAAFDFLRPILVVVRLPQIDGRIGRETTHTLGPREGGEATNPERSNKTENVSHNFELI